MKLTLFFPSSPSRAHATPSVFALVFYLAETMFQKVSPKNKGTFLLNHNTILTVQSKIDTIMLLRAKGVAQ